MKVMLQEPWAPREQLQRRQSRQFRQTARWTEAFQRLRCSLQTDPQYCCLHKCQRIQKPPTSYSVESKWCFHDGEESSINSWFQISSPKTTNKPTRTTIPSLTTTTTATTTTNNYGKTSGWQVGWCCLSPSSPPSTCFRKTSHIACKHILFNSISISFLFLSPFPPFKQFCFCFFFVSCFCVCQHVNDFSYLPANKIKRQFKRFRNTGGPPPHSYSLWDEM